MPQIQADAAKERPDPEVLGQLPVPGPIHGRQDGEEPARRYFQRLEAMIGESCRTKIMSV